MNSMRWIPLLMIVSQNVFSNDRIIGASCNIWGKLKVKAITEGGDEVQYAKDFKRKECNRIKSRIRVEAPLISTTLRVVKKFESNTRSIPDKREYDNSKMSFPGTYRFICETYATTEYFLDLKLSDSTTFTLFREESIIQKETKGKCARF